MKKNITLGTGFTINLETLLATRLLIAANSGGGKSWALRKLLEETNGEVQQIVIDLEGEFYSLRDKFDDYLLIGKDGDMRADVRAAGMLATKLLELGASAVLDLSELKFHERKHFVRLFLENMMEAPEELWRPVMVVIDEAHHFAPQVEENEARAAVIDLMTRGRKRGFCGILATQRISKLHKDAIGECNNKMFGRTSQDIDMKRTSDELGLSTKAQTFELRSLKPGEFFAFGTAIGSDIQRVVVGPVKTAHQRRATGKARKTTAPKAALKAILSNLADLPQKAEEEKKTVSALQARVRELEKAPRAVPATEMAPMGVSQWRAYGQERGYYDYFEKQINQAAGKEWEKVVNGWKKYAAAMTAIVIAAQKALSVEWPPMPDSKPEGWMTPSNIVEMPVAPGAEIRKGDLVTMTPKGVVPTRDSVPLPLDTHNGNGTPELKKGARQLVAMLALRHPEALTKPQLGTLVGFKSSGGTFGTYISHLKTAGLIEDKGGMLSLTEAGLAYDHGEEIPATPEERRELWRGRVKEGARKMFDVLVEVYPASMTKEELGQRLSMIHTGGTFGTYISHLKTAGMITVEGGELRAAEEMMA